MVYFHNYIRSQTCTHAVRKQLEPASSIGRKTERQTVRQKQDIWKNLEGIELKVYDEWLFFFFLILPLPSLLQTYLHKNLFGELETGVENGADKPNHHLSIACRLCNKTIKERKDYGSWHSSHDWQLCAVSCKLATSLNPARNRCCQQNWQLIWERYY